MPPKIKKQLVSHSIVLAQVKQQTRISCVGSVSPQVKYFQGDLPAALLAAEPLQAAHAAPTPASPAPTAEGQYAHAFACVAAEPTIDLHTGMPSAAQLSQLVSYMRELVSMKEEGNAALKAGKGIVAAVSCRLSCY